MRLKKFLLNEKVSKKEIDSILKSDDILVGAEFEFITNEVGISENLESMYDDAYEDWEEYMSELGKFQNEHNRIAGDISDVESNLRDVGSDIEKVEYEIEKLETLNYEEDKDKLEGLRDRLSKLKKEEDELNDELGDLESKEEDLERPAIGDDYKDYVKKIGQYENWDMPSDGDEIDDPIEPSSLLDNDLYDERKMDEHGIENWIWDISPSPPFDNYEVGEHGEIHQPVGSKVWAVEPDSTLSMGGVEIKSPAMPMKDFVKTCPKMFDWISKVGFTDSSCGFHIHMSIKSVRNLRDTLDIVKLNMFMDEGYIYKYFKDRKHSTYARSTKSHAEATLGTKAIKDFLEMGHLDVTTGTTHYDAINWEGLTGTNQNIEFRYMGDKNYHKKWSSIKNIIAQYAYNLDIACNPKSHRKEYIRKIQRVLNRIDAIKYYKAKEYFENLKPNKKIQDKVKMMVKKYDRLFKSLDTGSMKKGIWFELLYRKMPKPLDMINDGVEELYKEYKRRGGNLSLVKFIDIIEID